MNKGPRPHADTYRKSCGEHEPTFMPDVIIPARAAGDKSILRVEEAKLLGRVFAQENAAEIQQIMVALGEVDKVDGIPITKSFTGLTVTIGTTATKIITPNQKRPYLILNPALETTGQTTSDVIEDGVTKTADSTSAAINVAGVEDLHIFFDPTAVTGRWKIWLQALDPASGNYADTQMLFDTGDSEIAAGAGPYYAYVGSHGIAGTSRFRYEEVDVGSITFDIGIIRKKNVGSLDVSTGVPRTIYLGQAGVSTGSGYPLLEGEQGFFVIDQNVELYGIAQTPTDIKLFQLEA